MDWNVAQAISEIIGCVVVVISLLLLSRDLRQNTKAMKAANYIKVNDTMIENTVVLTEGQPVGQIFLDAMGGLEALEGVEYYCFHMVALGMLRRYETLFVQQAMGLMDVWSTEGFENSLCGLLAHKGIQQWWAGSQSLFSPDFATYINEHMLTVVGDVRGHGIADWEDSGKSATAGTGEGQAAA